MIKLLGLEHLDALKALNMSRDRQAGVSSSQMGGAQFYSEHGYKNYYLNPDNVYYRTYGYFYQDQLVSTLNMQFNVRRPCWYLHKVLSDPGIEIPNVPLKGVAELMSYVIRYAEKKGVFDYYSIIPLRYAKVHERIWSGLVPERKRYDIVFDHVVPSMQKPAYEEYWVAMLRSTLWPQDMLVRHHILRQEFRPDFNTMMEKYSGQ